MACCRGSYWIFVGCVSGQGGAIAHCNALEIATDGRIVYDFTRPATGAIAVFFGPGNVHNISARVTAATQLSASRVELLASLTALQKALSIYTGECRCNQQCFTRGDQALCCLRRIVIKTESQYVYETMTIPSHMWRWPIYNEPFLGGIMGRVEIEQISQVISLLNSSGIEVNFHHVRSGSNRIANGLVRAAFLGIGCVDIHLHR